MAQWAKDHLQENNLYQRRYNSVPLNRIRRSARAAIKRAKDRGLPYDESIIDTLSKAIPTVCDCCGKELDYSLGTGLKERAPSLDRLHTELGYVEGNVFVICVRCNRLKCDAVLPELEMVMAYIKGNRCTKSC